MDFAKPIQQNALFKERDNSSFIGTILMDLSKAMIVYFMIC